MTHVRALRAGFIVAAAITITSSHTAAQTTAPGAYYAPPAWSQTLPSGTRFIVLSNFNSEAVLDRETGLVWERSPLTAFVTLEEAVYHCAGRRIAARKGWRVPTLAELQSLIETSQFPALPENHPFTNVLFNDSGTRFYWSTTPTPSSEPVRLFGVDFGLGGLGGIEPTASIGVVRVWCVRGPQ